MKVVVMDTMLARMMVEKLEVCWAIVLAEQMGYAMALQMALMLGIVMVILTGIELD